MDLLMICIAGTFRMSMGKYCLFLLMSTIKLAAKKYHCDNIDSVPAMSTLPEQVVNQASTPQSTPLLQQAQKVEDVVNVYPVGQVADSPVFRYQCCSLIDSFF
jgi:hypothetical protein